MTRLWNQASISQNFLVFYNWVKQTLVHKYRYQHKRLRQNVIYQNFPCLRCLPVSTGDGRFIEQSEPHFSEPSRKICYVKNWSYFTLGDSRRASFHQHFVYVIPSFGNVKKYKFHLVVMYIRVEKMRGHCWTILLMKSIGLITLKP